MPAVKEVVVHKVDEELAAAGVRAGVCHRDGAAIVFIAGRELVLYRVPRTSCAVPFRISALYHETVDDPVEDDAIVESLADKFLEVTRRDGHVGCKIDSDGTHIRFKPGNLPGRCWRCHGYGTHGGSGYMKIRGKTRNNKKELKGIRSSWRG